MGVSKSWILICKELSSSRSPIVIMFKLQQKGGGNKSENLFAILESLTNVPYRCSGCKLNRDHGTESWYMVQQVMVQQAEVDMSY